MEYISDRALKIIRKEYAETVRALREAERTYNRNRKSKQAQGIFAFCAAQEQELSNLCDLLNVPLWDDEFNLVEYNEIIEEI